MRGVEQLSEAAPEYFGAKWPLAYCYKERSMDPKISCVIPRYSTTLEGKGFNGVDHRRLERPRSTSLQAKDKTTIDI
jgi:hypothetical protein